MSILDRLIGRPLPSDQEHKEKIGVLTGIPTLGLDALGSAAYGPEAALAVLIPLGALGLRYIEPTTLVIVVLLAILALSYRQTIAAYPHGGGSYTVAKENLGTYAGLLSAAALMLDYTLNVAVGISAGIGALVSAFPALHSHILPLCLAMLAGIATVNLRGSRESGVLFAIPTYTFIATLAITILWGVIKTVHSGGHPHAVAAPAALAQPTRDVGIWLLLRAFASGCTAMTGVEAVSNGVDAFKEPRVRNATRTLMTISIVLGALIIGVAYLSHAYGIGAMRQTRAGYQSVLSQLILAVMGRGVYYYVSIASILAVLALSANTSYAGFPRLCRRVAEDGFLPHSFAELGRRLVYSVGIVFLTTVSGLLLIAFGGVTDRLIPLFAVGAFLAFCMSQAGMVAHWLKRLKKDEGASKSSIRASLAVNAVGLSMTLCALAVIVFTKFLKGAWIVILLIPVLMAAFIAIRRHYLLLARQIRLPHPLDLGNLAPPIVVVPIDGINKMTEQALRFSLRLSPDVNAVHILTGNRKKRGKALETPDDRDDRRQTDDLRRRWEQDVEAPARMAGLRPPRLVILPSPYRKLHEPLLNYIDQLQREQPGRLIALVIPELIERSWWEVALHNHHASWLRARLVAKGDNRVVSISVPWYIDQNPPSQNAAHAQ